MILKEITEKLNVEILTGETGLTNEVKGGYTSDLLSDVMGNSRQGDIWITMQTHMNVVAVAMLRDHAAVIMVGGNRPSDEIIEKAVAEGLPLLSTSNQAFTVSGQLYSLLND